MTMCGVSPEIVEPDWVMLDDTMIAMYPGIVAGGGVELPGSVDQFTPQVGDGGVSSKPLNAAGAVPPERELSFHHRAPQNVTD
jgi:hypothetical protein